MELIEALSEAIDLIIQSPYEEVVKAIKQEYGEDDRDFIADELAYLAVMLKHGGDSD